MRNIPPPINALRVKTIGTMNLTSLTTCFLSAQESSRAWESETTQIGWAKELRARLAWLLLSWRFGGETGSMMCRTGGTGVRTLCMWETFLLCVCEREREFGGERERERGWLAVNIVVCEKGGWPFFFVCEIYRMFSV